MARRPPKLSATHAIAYIRVSTDEQALGPDAQRAAIARWALASGVTVAAERVDLGVSGGAGLDERPGLMAALADVEALRAGMLVVAKRDRLARDVIVAAAVERLAESKGARVVSADGVGNGTGPEALLLRGMVDVVAQYERELIRARTRAALGVKRARGERIGTVPIGYHVGEGSKLLLHADEQGALQRIAELRAAGFTIRAIADALNDEGIAARGRRWHASTIALLLQRAA